MDGVHRVITDPVVVAIAVNPFLTLWILSPSDRAATLINQPSMQEKKPFKAVEICLLSACVFSASQESGYIHRMHTCGAGWCN